MEHGTKEYYLDALKHVMMMKLVTTEAQSLASTHALYVEQIRNSTTMTDEQKEHYKNNLQQAYEQVLFETIGSSGN
jgi:TfoX/Sxy family transcriptional regulator of competence genes